MKEDLNYGSLQGTEMPPVVRKAGRPRAIPTDLEPTVLKLYRLGYGYRAIARILRQDCHVNPDFSTVKRTLKRLNILPRQNSAAKSSHSEIVTTILSSKGGKRHEIITSIPQAEIPSVSYKTR